MKLDYLVVKSEDDKYKFEFNKNTLIYSKDNSKGKTTLIRFILYALGYQIPATEGIGDFDKFDFELKINVKNKGMILNRKGNLLRLFVENSATDFVLPAQESELFASIFGIDNVTVLNNLLAVFYIDQEKGWTLLNRGKIIGNNRFNIEEFIAGISGISINELLDEKRVLNHELKKYRYFKNVVDINSEFETEEDDKTILNYEKRNLDELLVEQNQLELELKKTETDRRRIEGNLTDNKKFANTIESYGLMVSYKGEEFCLTKDNLMDYKFNQELLRIQIENCKIKESKLKRRIQEIIHVINEKNTLFSMDDLFLNLEKSIEINEIDVTQIDKVIRQLTNKRNQINKSIKDKLVFNNNQLLRFYQIIEMYADELGISKYISEKGPKFVLTNQLKGLSGRVLAQMSFVFKLSYIRNIDEIYGLKLPIIIDSPRTNELSEESTNDMMKILKRDFNRHQIIIASIYKNGIIDFSEISLNDGLMSKK